MSPAEIRLLAEVQHLADRVVEAVEGRVAVAEHPALVELGDWLNENTGSMHEVVCDRGNWVHAPYLEDVVERVRDNYVGDDGPERILSEVARVLERALDAEEWYWGYEYWVPICGTLRHSDGRSCVLRLSLSDYLSGPYDWDGVYRDMPALLAALVDEGRIVRMSQLGVMRDEVAAFWDPQVMYERPGSSSSSGEFRGMSNATTRVSIIGYVDPAGEPRTVVVPGWDRVLEQLVVLRIDFVALQGQIYVERPYRELRDIPRDLTVVELLHEVSKARMVQEFVGHIPSEEAVRAAVSGRLGKEVLEWTIVGTHMLSR
jgi:hypothetical protein